MEKWQETIIKGMKLISKGCKKQVELQEYSGCLDCPFKIPCDTMDEAEYTDYGYEIVQDWEDIYGTS